MSDFTLIKKNPTQGEITSSLTGSTGDGAGLHFDGGAIDIASPPDLGSKFSFEFVIKADEWPTTSDNDLIHFGNGGNFLLYGNDSAGGNLGIADGGAFKDFGVAILDDLKVHHLVLTVDGTAAILYDNGNQVATATISLPTIDSCSDAKIGSNYASATTDNFIGNIYRCRFYNKALEPDEVQTAYERADVDFADQYGSQTTINSGTTTKGKRYRITARDGVDFTTVGAVDNNVGTEFLATGSVTLDGNDTVVRIGAAVDLDLAFANPLQSFVIQDRSTNNVDGTASNDGTNPTGISQVQVIKQLNATAARIGTTAATPVDGQILTSGDIGVGGSPSTTASTSTIEAVNSGTARVLMKSTGTGGREYGLWTSTSGNLGFFDYTAGANRLTIDANGAVGLARSATSGYRLDVHGRSGYDDVVLIEGNGTNMGPRINLTPTGTGTSRINATANDLALQTGGTSRLTISSTGDITSTNATASKPLLQLENTTGDNSSSQLVFYKNRSATNNDNLGTVRFKGKNNAGSP